MNALIAVICTIGVLALLVVIVKVIEEYGEGIFMLILAFVLLVLPVVLSIWGLIARDFGKMIGAEVVAFIASLLISLNSNNSPNWINFVPLLPAILLLIMCIIGNIVVGAVIMIIIVLFQLSVTLINSL